MVATQLETELERLESVGTKPLPPCALKFRCEMRFYILLALSLATYFIAASLGSGWALFLTSCLLCICLLSIVLPVLVLRSIQAKINGPEMLSAGDEIPLVVNLLAGKSFRPFSRWLIVQALPDKLSLFREEKSEAILFDQIPASAITLTCPGLKRGVRRLPLLALETSFPFGLVWCNALFQAETSLVVLPRCQAVEGRFLFRLRSCAYVPGESRASRNGLQNSSSSRGIRNYRRGDSRRFIHWSSSARHGSLMVREFEKEGLPAFDLVFDLSAGWENPEQFELAISACATLLHLGHRLGIHPELYFIESWPELSGRSTDIDQQLFLLAALEFKNLAGKKLAGGRSPQGVFEWRDKAVVLVSALTEPLAAAWEDASAGSRISVFNIKVSPLPVSKFTPAHSHEFILAKPEDLASL